MASTAAHSRRHFDKLLRSPITLRHSLRKFFPASQSEVLDSGITNADTTTVSYSGQGGLTHQLN